MSGPSEVLPFVKTGYEFGDENPTLEFLEDLSEDTGAPITYEFNEQDPLDEAVDPVKLKQFVTEFQDEDLLDDDEKEDFVLSPKRERRSTTPPETRQALESDAQAKCKGPADSVSNPLEAWLLILDEPIQVQILKYTNAEIKRRNGQERFQKATDLVELRAWLGLQYLCGIFRNSEHNGPLEELWSAELGNTIFEATITVKRFEFLLECVRFGEEGEESKRNTVDAVFQIWEKLIINCRSYYSPSSHCTIDDCLLHTTDKSCPYSCSLPRKPNERGMRLVLNCDAKTLYMFNAIVATDAEPNEQEAMHLVKDIKSTKRNVCLGERYATLSLVDRLLQHKLSAVGVISQQDVPLELWKLRTGNKIYAEGVVLTGLSSNEGDEAVLLTSVIPSKVSGQKLYQATRKCCQRFHQQSSIFSTAYAMRHMEYNWRLQFFHLILNYSAMNAWIMLRLSHKGNATMTQRDFQRQLGLFLNQQLLKRRLQRNSKVSHLQRLKICEILGESTDALLCEASRMALDSAAIATVSAEKAPVPDEIKLMPKFSEKRARCRKCPSHSNPKVRWRCQQCVRPLCMRHLIVRCDDCMGVPELPKEPYSSCKDMD